MQKTTTVEEIAVKEEMIYVNHAISEKNVVVGTRLYNSNNQVIKEDAVVISNAYYETLIATVNVLISENDLWETVDKVRNKSDV